MDQLPCGARAPQDETGRWRVALFVTVLVLFIVSSSFLSAAETAPEVGKPTLGFLRSHALKFTRVQPHALTPGTAIDLYLLESDFFQLFSTLGTVQQGRPFMTVRLYRGKALAGFLQRFLFFAVKVFFFETFFSFIPHVCHWLISFP